MPPTSIFPTPLALLVLAMVAADAGGAGAQTLAPYSTLEVLGAGVLDADAGRLDEYWHRRHGGLLRVSTPFHVGNAAATVRSSAFTPRGASQPAFRMISAAVEWNLATSIGGVRPFAGIQVGAASMRFDDDETDNPNENEFLAGVQAGVSLPIAAGLGVTVMATHRTVFTRLPIRLASAVVGLSYALPAPALVRALLE